MVPAPEAGQPGFTAPRPTVLVVMGVSGSGKSTVGAALARALGWAFEEGDDLHPAANIAKQAAGLPLTDADRAPWLARVAAWIAAQQAAGRPGVITCSALRRRYRDQLRGPGVRLVQLAVPEDELARRLAARRGHFMPSGLLGAQLATFEAPAPDEDVLVVAADGPPAAVVDRIRAALGLAGPLDRSVT